MPPSANRLLKGLGVASVVGVVATGVLVARNERERRAYTPDEVRQRLHDRVERADPAAPPGHVDAGPAQR